MSYFPDVPNNCSSITSSSSFSSPSICLELATNRGKAGIHRLLLCLQISGHEKAFHFRQPFFACSITVWIYEITETSKSTQFLLSFLLPLQATYSESFICAKTEEPSALYLGGCGYWMVGGWLQKIQQRHRAAIAKFNVSSSISLFVPWDRGSGTRQETHLPPLPLPYPCWCAQAAQPSSQLFPI